MWLIATLRVFIIPVGGDMNSEILENKKKQTFFIVLYNFYSSSAMAAWGGSRIVNAVMKWGDP